MPDESNEMDPKGGTTNNCIFLGCYSEGDGTGIDNQIGKGATIIGGAAGYQHAPTRQGPFGTRLAVTDTDGYPLEWGGWINSSNQVDGQPLVYTKIIANADASRVLVTAAELGQKSDYANLDDLARNVPGVLKFGLTTPTPTVRALLDSNVLKYDETLGWWSIEKPIENTRTLCIAGDLARPRRPAPLFPNGVFYATTPDLSTVDDPVLRPPANNSKETVSHRVVTDKPAAPVDGSETWEKGDIAWDANPTKTGPVGWRCIRAGTWGARRARPDPLTIDVDPLDRTKVTFSSFAELPLWLWGYIDIEGVGVVQIVSRPEAGADATVFVDPAVPGVAEDDLPVRWAEPLIVPFGNQSTRSTSVDDDELTAYDHHVSCTTVPLNISIRSARRVRRSGLPLVMATSEISSSRRA